MMITTSPDSWSDSLSMRRSRLVSASGSFDVYLGSMIRRNGGLMFQVDPR